MAEMILYIILKIKQYFDGLILLFYFIFHIHSLDT